MVSNGIVFDLEGFGLPKMKSEKTAPSPKSHRTGRETTIANSTSYTIAGFIAS